VTKLPRLWREVVECKALPAAAAAAALAAAARASAAAHLYRHNMNLKANFKSGPSHFSIKSGGRN